MAYSKGKFRVGVDIGGTSIGDFAASGEGFDGKYVL